MDCNIVNFNSCVELKNHKKYGGFSKKTTVIYDGERYMLKIPPRKKKGVGSYKDSNISEYVGCKIFEKLLSIDYKVQETILGYYEDKKVVACKDFTYKNKNRIIPFGEYKRMVVGKTLDSYSARLSTTLKALEAPIRLQNGKNIKTFFWDMFVVDVLIANGDRHLNNFGFLADARDPDVKTLAPIFDCGSSLNPNMSAQQKESYLNNKDYYEKIAYGYPLWALCDDDREVPNKINFFEYIVFSNNLDMLASLIKICSRIEMQKILKIVEDIPTDYIGKTNKDFLKLTLSVRYDMLINYTFKALRKTFGENNLVEIDKMITKNIDVDFINKNNIQNTFVKNYLIKNNGEYLIKKLDENIENKQKQKSRSICHHFGL